MEFGIIHSVYLKYFMLNSISKLIYQNLYIIINVLFYTEYMQKATNTSIKAAHTSNWPPLSLYFWIILVHKAQILKKSTQLLLTDYVKKSELKKGGYCRNFMLI